MTETLRNGKRKAVLEALRLGNTRKAAAAAAGIHFCTLYRWLDENSPYYDATLCDEITRAEQAAEAVFVAAVHAAAVGFTSTRRVTVKKAGCAVVETEELTPVRDWRAAVEWLKRRRREDWGDSLAVKLERMSDDELDHFIRDGLPLPIAAGSAESAGDAQNALAYAGGANDPRD